MKENSLISFVAGAAVGAALGVLFAPERGEVTRRRIRSAAKDGCDMAKDTYASAARKAAAVKDDIEELRDVLREEGEEIRDSVRSRISERLDRLEKALVEAMEDSGEDDLDEDSDDYETNESEPDDYETGAERCGENGKPAGNVDGRNDGKAGEAEEKDGDEENAGDAAGRKIDIA